MRIACLGGGPAGLYFSILMKKANPKADITVFERNKADDTFGWGVVFSDKTMGGFRAEDPKVVDQIERAFRHWDDIDVHFKGRKFTSSGHGFCGIARKKLLEIFHARAEELGVTQNFQTHVQSPELFEKQFDLVIGSDGVFSTTRGKYESHFNPRIAVGKNRFIWLGTRKKLDAFTFAFKETEWGWFNLHAYRFDEEWSTFIVETPEEVWKAAGLDKLDPDQSVAFCEKIFGDLLDGNKLVSNAKHLRGSGVWLKFNRVLCERWFKDNVVLLGDAAHTAHFGIGSGTKLAMEDAIALTKVLTSTDGAVSARLARYQAEREIEALKLQSAARNRQAWFEDIDRYVRLAPEQFVFSLLTGSQRVGYENSKLRDPAYVASFDKWFSTNCGVLDHSVPPMFTRFSLRVMTVPNRVVVSPMCMYSATDGVPNDFHLVHYGRLAMGGAGLIFTEMTDVCAEGRITPGCTGMYTDEHELAWKRVVDFVHGHSGAKIAMQLGHAGRKGATKTPQLGMDLPLDEGGWELIAPSPIPYIQGVSKSPREMTRADMDRVRDQFVAAARRADRAGFDMIELHAAHGYLLSSFISPLTNTRSDEHGGALANRLRFPLEVFRAIRAVWPAKKPISVRISAHDWAPGGIDPESATDVARLFKLEGADILHVSSGQVVKEEKPVYGRMFQVPFSDRIRNELGIPTITVGNIFEHDHVNTIIAAGRADLCAIARPHLADPAWTLHAAAELGHQDIQWPVQYGSSRAQYEKNLQRAKEILALQA